MSKFWEHYEAAKPHMANAVDDVRHKLVEEAWFGRQTTGSINEGGGAGEQKQDPLGWGQSKQDPLGWSQPAQEKPEELGHKHAALYEEVWGPAPKHSDIYGNGPKPSGPTIEPSPTPQKDPVHGPDF